MDTPIELREQALSAVLLTAAEAQELSKLSFDVISDAQPASPTARDVQFDQIDGTAEPTGRLYLVNPGCQVGHFRLQSHSQRTVRIQPKVGIRNVFSLLAAAYAFYSDRESPFRGQTVDYNLDKTELLEPLVQHFNDKVKVLLQDGLLASYVEQEENLKVFRGRLAFSRHLARNLVRGDRLHCRFFQSEVDIPENQVILWTLFLLSRSGKWTPEVRRVLRSHILHFGGVSVRQFLPRQCPVFHYDRLSSRYREVHSWCRLFIDLLSISDSAGDRTFNGYVLDMNLLFERFVISMFERAEDAVPLVSVQHHIDYNLTLDGVIRICPDLTLNGPSKSTVAVDAKYKKTAASGLAKHPDLYQVIAYCTALGLTGQENTPVQGILVYPVSERTPELEGVLHVITSKVPSSEIAIRTIWLELECDDPIGEAKRRFITLLKEMSGADVSSTEKAKQLYDRAVQLF